MSEKKEQKNIIAIIRSSFFIILFILIYAYFCIIGYVSNKSGEPVTNETILFCIILIMLACGLFLNHIRINNLIKSKENQKIE